MNLEFLLIARLQKLRKIRIAVFFVSGCEKTESVAKQKQISTEQAGQDFTVHLIYNYTFREEVEKHGQKALCG